MRFNRPALPEEKGQLVDTFSGSAFLKGQPAGIRRAAEKFKSETERIFRGGGWQGVRCGGVESGMSFFAEGVGSEEDSFLFVRLMGGADGVVDMHCIVA